MLDAGWVERVRAERPAVAVFDCDGTLWRGDAGSGFMEWSLEPARGLVRSDAREWLQKRYRGYQAGTVDEATICGEMVQVYAGVRESDLRGAAGVFFREAVATSIFAEMERLVGELREAGTVIWAVSSTSQWVIEAAVVERFGIPAERVLAARVRVVNGVATDELLAVPTDEAKAEALRREGVGCPEAVFGNSIHDLAMLEMARKPYAVNPSTELQREAESRGWEVYWPGAEVGAEGAV